MWFSCVFITKMLEKYLSALFTGFVSTFCVLSCPCKWGKWCKDVSHLVIWSFGRLIYDIILIRFNVFWCDWFGFMQIFKCFAAWLNFMDNHFTEYMTKYNVLTKYCFESLANDELFDEAVLCIARVCKSLSLSLFYLHSLSLSLSVCAVHILLLIFDAFSAIFVFVCFV